MRLMKSTFYASLAAISLTAITLSAPAAAKNPSPKKLMDMAASCAYVVGIAEQNNVAMNYSSADWASIIRQLEQATGMDSEPSLQLAKAKYNRRARIMGADEAFKYMLSGAKDCDREMGVIMAP